ncbi:MAG TPA: SHOCT domain-containing protein [Phototrophicaceae bacterium]|nr:SHOCT domain-containing protein [Phototrophicaceae bacterium]
MGKLGLLMIVGAVIWLVVTIFSPSIFAPLASLYCPAGQTLASQQVAYSDYHGSGFNNYFSCTDGTHKTDVTSQVTLTMIGIFAVLLVGGMIVSSFSRRKSNSVTIGSPTNPINLSGTGAINLSGAGGIPTTTATTSTYVMTPNGYVGGNPTTNPAVADIMSGLQRGVIRFGGQEIPIADLKSGAYQQMMMGGQHTLADTLRQLEDAHKQGLINDDEYNHLRQDALNKLV